MLGTVTHVFCVRQTTHQARLRQPKNPKGPGG